VGRSILHEEDDITALQRANLKTADVVLHFYELLDWHFFFGGRYT
jgi:hypothetical protein